jgi:hypothetical protein
MLKVTERFVLEHRVKLVTKHFCSEGIIPGVYSASEGYRYCCAADAA